MLVLTLTLTLTTDSNPNPDPNPDPNPNPNQVRLCSCDASTRAWLEAQHGAPMAPDEPLPNDAGARDPNALRAGMHLPVGNDNLPVGDTTRGGYLTGRGMAVTFGHCGSRHLHLGRRESAEPDLPGDGGGIHERLPVEAFGDDIDDGRRGTAEVEDRRVTAAAVGRRAAAEGRHSAVRWWVDTATGSPFINPPHPSEAAWVAEEEVRAQAEAAIGRRAAERGEVATAWRELEGSEAARAMDDRATLAAVGWVAAYSLVLQRALRAAQMVDVAHGQGRHPR